MRNSEIRDDHGVGTYENICWLQIAMNDADVMSSFQSRSDLTRIPHCLVDRHLSRTSDYCREVRSVDERHRDVLDSVHFAEVVNAYDVLVRDLARKYELLLESTPPLRRVVP